MYRRIMTAAIAGLLATGTSAQEATEIEDYLLEIGHIQVEYDEMTAFTEALGAYKACYAGKGGKDGWAAWHNHDGAGFQYYIVSRIDRWSELDAVDEADRACWAEHAEALLDTIERFDTYYARKLPAWSGTSPEASKVVRLHQFRVDNGPEFRSTIGEITRIMKDAGYPHVGSWFDVQGGARDYPHYFAVEYFDDFAAMDEERAGPYQTVVDAAGAKIAEELWEQYRDSLENAGGYWNQLIHYNEALSFEPGQAPAGGEAEAKAADRDADEAGAQPDDAHASGHEGHDEGHHADGKADEAHAEDHEGHAESHHADGEADDGEG